MPAVLATDAGLLLEPRRLESCLPSGAPEMSFGSVAYARTDQIHRTDLTLKELGKATGAWEGIVGSL
jgi:hypothetical protein